MEPTRHIIIDNETGDILPSAFLLTIGAVAVEISDSGLIVLGRWYRRIEWWPLTLAQPDRTTSKSTLDWWNAQAPAPFSEAFDLDADRLPLSLAMHSLQAWLQLNPYPIWGNGSDFDNAQLQHAFTQHGLRWPYWHNRCLRSLRGTVLQLYPNTQLPDFPADKIKHHALHDAEHEAAVLAVLLRTLAAPGSSSLPEDFARLYRSRRFGQILAIRQDDDDTPQIAFHAQPDGLGVCQNILSYDDSDHGAALADDLFQRLDIDTAEAAVTGMFKFARQLNREGATA